MNIFRVADRFQRIWGPLHKIRFGVWTCLHDIQFPPIQEVLVQAWFAYSTPLPSSRSQLLSLFVTCCCTAVSIGSLFHCWMVSSLRYPFQFSAWASSALSFLVLLTLLLMHPVRCMFTIMVPTLGTKQGQRLLRSTCFMIVALNIIPNIMNNIQALLQVLQCIFKNSAESIVTSMLLLGNASWDFSHFLKRVTDNIPDKLLTPRDSHVQFKNHSNIFQLNEKMTHTSQSIKEDIAHADMLVQRFILLANRMTAGFFLFCLLFQAAWYLKSYLTDLGFDNIYITQKLEDLARENKTMELLNCPSKKLIKATSLKLSREELKASLRQFFLLSLVLVVILFIIATDYIAFHLAQTAATEVTQIPNVPSTFWIKYDIKLKLLGFEPPLVPPFEKLYHQNLTFVSASCLLKKPTPPNAVLAVGTVLLYGVIYAMIVLETYSYRLCRKISASFFESQENQRIQYLYKKLVRKQKEKAQQEAAVFC